MVDNIAEKKDESNEIIVDDEGTIIIPLDEDNSLGDEEDILSLLEDDDEPDEAPKNGLVAKETAFAWKDKGVDLNEMSSRRINRKKALENEEKSKTSFKNNDGKRTTPTAQLAAGLQKLNTKIKQNVYDEDENETFVFVGTLNDNSLANALSKEENKELKQQKENNTNRLHQNAAKLEAVNNAERLAKQAGINVTAKTADKNMGDAMYNQNTMAKTLNKDLAKELKIKKPGKIPASKNKDLVKGVKNIKEMGGKVENMDIKTVAKAANTDNKGVAEIIYKNASNTDKKKIHQQTDVKKLIEKTGRAKSSSKEKEKKAVKEIEKGNVRLEPQKSKGQKSR